VSRVLTATVWVHDLKVTEERRYRKACVQAFPFRDWWYDSYSRFLEGSGRLDTARTPEILMQDVCAFVWEAARGYRFVELEVLEEGARVPVLLTGELPYFRACNDEWSRQSGRIVHEASDHAPSRHTWPPRCHVGCL
jgi:hypothetical protein